MTEDLETRFWSKADKAEDCWLWTAARNRLGYGMFGFLGNARLAHRVSFFLTYGRWPAPQTDHTCKNKGCVRPDHLEEVTSSTNLRRIKGTDEVCGQGHPRTPENTYLEPGRSSTKCKECNRQAVRSAYTKRRSILVSKE